MVFAEAAAAAPTGASARMGACGAAAGGGAMGGAERTEGAG